MNVSKGIIAFEKKKIDNIIITRSPVETGPSLGFLKGDKEEKFFPYLVPMLDAFEQVLGKKDLDELLRTNIIKAMPIGLMRGTTFKKSCVILDEGQNCTYDELKMFLTRIGNKSKIFLLGDNSQSDLRNTKNTAFSIVKGFLHKIRESVLVEYTVDDVVRDDIVRDFIIEFERHEDGIC